MASVRPAVFVVDDDEGTRWVLQRALEREGLPVVATGDPSDLFAAIESPGVDLVLLDLRLGQQSGLDVLAAIRERAPATAVVIITAYSTMETAIEAMKMGAFDYLVKPLDLDDVTAVVRRALRSGGRVAPEPDSAGAAFVPSVVGRSTRMQEIFKMVGRVAATDATVLIAGESGTGKELIARAIHRHSDRGAGPFVPVDCAAIPEGLLEAELFGHERGAFTNAVARRPGRFELAHQGTVFLDEVGELPLDLQAKLLRVLQERVVQRLGGVEPVPVDVRVVAATNRDLRRMVQEGRFRDDLFYRLNVLALELPPLRERREDIPGLVEHVLAKYAPRLGRRRLSTAALARLVRYHWPGNVRELENVVHRAMVTAPDGVIRPEDLPPELAEPPAEQATNPSFERLVERELRGFVTALRDTGEGALWRTLLSLVERPLLRVVLQETGGNQVRAARLLGINRNTLRKRVRALGLASSRVGAADRGRPR
jgi:two-component system, NtrC family, nitrogen regulation response regulator GlnG